MVIEKTKKRPAIVKRGVQAKTIEKVAAQIQAAETAVQENYESRQVVLSQIKLWEEQPRHTSLTLEDIYQGYINVSDKKFKKKESELESLISLALSIKEFGMLNEPIAYSLPGKTVQLIGGERRTMAAIYSVLHIKTVIGEDHSANNEVNIDKSPDLNLLDYERIAIKCYVKKPDEVTLERIGMTDNSQRKDIQISDKLRWLIKFHKHKESLGQNTKWNDLVETMALNRSQAFKWLKILKTQNDTWVAKVISLVLAEKTSFNRLIEIAETSNDQREELYNRWFVKKIKTPLKSKISLGTSTNFTAIRSLVLNNLDKKEKKKFESVNWENSSEVKRAFADFMVIWEKQNG